MLTDYISGIADRVTADKLARGISPPAVTLRDILDHAIPDIKQAMRDIARHGRYRTSITVNKDPMLIRLTGMDTGPSAPAT